ncbi:MAG: murein biosynthesis integral membrane protein MurJ [Bdellovibrionales bacterium GWA2_49_15]|nr:MAG: murein biosynthesis integral membrane protein MurJ [Bdellovibrionales bacterium GWA2_49_15]
MSAPGTGQTTRKVFFSSAKMAVATFISRILGLVREQLMAHIFGASGMTDAFLVAYRLPNMLRDLFAEGAFSSAFVPIFTEVNQKDSRGSHSLFWSMSILLGVVTGAISLILMIFAEPIVAFVAPSFSDNPEIFRVTVVLTQIMAPFLLLVSLAALAMGALNTQKIFFIPALSPACFNLVSILCMLGVPALLTSQGYNPIYALGFGVMLGGLAQLGLQLPLVAKRIPFTGPLVFWGPNQKRIVSRLGIGTIGIAAAQVNILINTILATGTVVGAVSWLTYAFRLFQFPVGMLGVSIASSNLVHFSDAWKKGERQEAINFLQTSYNLLTVLLIPVTVVMLALSEPIIHLVFLRGKFGATDVLNTAAAFRFYLLGLPFYGIYKVFAPTFYTLDRPSAAVSFSVGSILVNILFCWWAVPRHGFAVLALGTGLAMFLNVVCQTIYLQRHLKLSWLFFVRPLVLKSIVSGLVTYRLMLYIQSYYPHQESLLYRTVVLGTLALFGLGIFASGLLALGETATLRALWNARRRQKKNIQKE